MNVKTLSLRSLQVHLKVAIVALCMAAALFVMPHPAQAAQLNEAQIQAIVGLLQSFDVDPATVNHVNSILRGTNTSGSSRHGTFSVSAPAAERSFSPGDTLAINWNDTTATAATRYHIVLWPHTYPNGSGWPLAGSGYGLDDATGSSFSWTVDTRPRVGSYIVRVCRLGEDVCGVSRTIRITAQTTHTTPTADIKINDSDGPLYVNDNQAITVRWTSTNTAGCYITNVRLTPGASNQSVDNLGTSGSRVFYAAVLNNNGVVAVQCGAANDQVQLLAANTNTQNTTVLPRPYMHGYVCSTDNTQVTLAWDSVSNAGGNATAYPLRVDDQALSCSGPLVGSAGNTGCVTDSTGSTEYVRGNPGTDTSTWATVNITPNTNYKWWVHAYNANGWSAYTKVPFSCSSTNTAGSYSLSIADITGNAVVLQASIFPSGATCQANYTIDFGDGSTPVSKTAAEAGCNSMLRAWPSHTYPTLSTAHTYTAKLMTGTTQLATKSVTIAATTQQVNGSCGSANGTTVSSAPSSNLCSAGTASGVVGTGPWNWVCTSSSGTTASCVASKTATTQVNGACGSANGTTVSTAPASNLCSVGTASGVVGTGPWNWVCSSSSGTTASCVAAKAEVAAPTATLTTNGALTNAIIESNGTIINAWSSTGADQWSSTIAMSGCYNTNLNTGTKSWTANTASGNGGTWSASPYAGCITTITYTAKNSATGKSATATMTNHVSPPSASVDLKVTTPTQSSSDGSATAPATVVLGQSLIWSWTAQNVSSCTLSWTGATSGSLSEPTTGSLTTSPSPAGSYVMKMTCLVPTGGSVSDSVNLVVTSGSQANTPSFNFLSAYSEAFNQNMAAVAVGIVDIPLSILTDALSDLFYYAGIY